VILATKMSTVNYKLWTSYIDIDNNYRFQFCGTWRWTNESVSLPSQVRRTAWTQESGNLGGREIKAVAVDLWPFFTVNQLPSGEWEPVSGVDYTILKTLAQNM
ncbi:unnamed protein product, partial [Meganyctiphanes norvegica]